MKLLLVAVALLMACGPGIPSTRTPIDKGARDHADALAHASQTGDVTAIRTLLGPKVTNGGLWFADPTCTNEFAAPGEIGGGRLDEFARCLAALKLVTSKRHELLADVAVLEYAPGIEIEARIIDTENGPWLSWIGYEGKRDAGDGLPTISPATLETLRDGGDPHPAGDGIQANESAWFKVCLDATGAVSAAHMRGASSMQAARSFGAAVEKWHFKPFTPNGQPLPVCSLVALAAPPGAKPPLPPPFASPNGEPILYPRLKRTRKSGLKLEDGVMHTMRANNLHRLLTVTMYCVSDRGEVYAARIISGSGIPKRDEEVLSSTKEEHFEPYRDDGKPVAFCTADVDELEVTP